MKIHEYQAKEILKRYGVPVPEGKVTSSPDEAEKIARELGGGLVVVKAQIHAGGRGKGGGVKLAKNPAEAREHANSILGMQLVTHQTGAEGKKVLKVYVEKGSEIEKEFYLGIVLDRAQSKPVIMASTEGGMEIEEVAKNTPEKIHKEIIDPALGVLPFQARKVAFALGLSGDAFKNCVKFVAALYSAYMATDSSMAEINPLVVTKSGEVLALDAKINIDDNALYRHKDLAEMRDTSEEDPLEFEASKFDLNYIKLDGHVGCMVNGAGLAMATMDIIKLAGGMPANFLDVGGSANVETVTNGFKIILSDPNVKAIWVNIFGGIVRCDRVAGGVVEAAKKVNINVPLVVRLEGTNAEEGAKILASSGIDLIVANGMKDGAEKVIKSIS